jgi:hypothetical protein
MNTLPASITDYLKTNHDKQFTLYYDRGAYWYAMLTPIDTNHMIVEGNTPEDAIAALDLKLKENI